ncbi:MAG: hypothetical protein V7776_22310 [Halopseudomonas aestusnigri]
MKQKSRTRRVFSHDSKKQGKRPVRHTGRLRFPTSPLSFWFSISSRACFLPTFSVSNALDSFDRN